MSSDIKTPFRAGRNIAMKVPGHQYEATVAFYQDILGLEQLHSQEDSVSFAFGSARLWLDRTDKVDHSEIWLEVQSDDTRKASHILRSAGIERCDEVEPLPDDVDGFWIRNPAGIIHLVSHPKETSE